MKKHSFPVSVVCEKYQKKHKQRQTIPINKILEQEHFPNKFNYEKLVPSRFFRSPYQFHLTPFASVYFLRKTMNRLKYVSWGNSQQCKVMLWNAFL